MHTNALAPATAACLKVMTGMPLLSACYLAGGTAVALHLGHRLSVDLDFFSGEPLDTLQLRQQLAACGRLQLGEESAGTLHGLLNDVQITFLEYRYPLLEPCTDFQGIAVAGLRDLACMTLDTIASRGKKRDFFDLYAIAQTGATLREMLDWFDKKYAGIQYNRIHLLKSLTYFADAETDPLPVLKAAITWDEVKRFFTQQAPKLV